MEEVRFAFIGQLGQQEGEGDEFDMQQRSLAGLEPGTWQVFSFLYVFWLKENK